MLLIPHPAAAARRLTAGLVVPAGQDNNTTGSQCSSSDCCTARPWTRLARSQLPCQAFKAFSVPKHLASSRSSVRVVGQ